MGQELPTSSGLWKSGRGLRQARTSRGLLFGPSRTSTVHKGPLHLWEGTLPSGIAVFLQFQG